MKPISALPAEAQGLVPKIEVADKPKLIASHIFLVLAAWLTVPKPICPDWSEFGARAA